MKAQPNSTPPGENPQGNADDPWQLKNISMNLQLHLGGPSSSFRLSRAEYMPDGETVTLPPWHALFSTPRQSSPSAAAIFQC